MIDHFLPLLWRERISLVQSLRVLSRCPLLRFLPRAVHVLREIGCQFVVIARNHGERRDQKNVGLIVSGIVLESFEVQHRRQQRDAVKRYAAVGEISGDARGTRGSVAFAEKEER